MEIGIVEARLDCGDILYIMRVKIQLLTEFHTSLQESLRLRIFILFWNLQLALIGIKDESRRLGH